MRKRILILILSFAGILGGLNLPGQSIIKQDGRFGIADDKGNVIAKPEFDSIWPLREYTNTFFIIKKKNKLAYCYRYELDSIYWLNESRRFWVTSRFDFDELQTMVVGLPGYSGSYSYTQIAYKQNGLWGIMYVQTKTGSGDGIFPSAGFYIAGFGALRLREAKYDSIFRIDRDAITPPASTANTVSGSPPPTKCMSRSLILYL